MLVFAFFFASGQGYDTGGCYDENFIMKYAPLIIIFALRQHSVDAVPM